MISADYRRGARSLATALFGAALLASATAPVRAAEGAKPQANILFVVLDDLGIDQLPTFGFGGPNPPKTPNLDKIAAEGVKFTNMWSMPECSPARAAFFAGRYPLRTGVISAIVNNHLPQDYLSSFEATIPRVLETAGYKSALVGKYHLGDTLDPAGDCAPSTRGWDVFRGNLNPGPPSIDTTAGGADPDGGELCGYVQGADSGACYRLTGNKTTCSFIEPANAAKGTTPSRTCLQAGGLFRPNQSCGISVPTTADFETNNAYYVWERFASKGAEPPLSLGQCQAGRQNRNYMTTEQVFDGAAWWNAQSGPRMLTLAFNAMHTPFQKAPTTVVPDPLDLTSTCSSAVPQRFLLNSIIEGADVEIGRMLEKIGLAKLDRSGRQIVKLDLGNTTLIVVNDNGSFGSTVRVADGFDAGRSKATPYQTGVWTPMIIAGAKVQSPGRDVDELVNAVDLFALFGELAGIDVRTVVPPYRTLDSKPLLPYLAQTNNRPIRRTSYTEVGAGTFTPIPEERSWPCTIAGLCNDTLLFSESLCNDNGGVWSGPGAAAQYSSCCAVVESGAASTIMPVHQFGVRNKRYKLVELESTNCSKPLKPGQKGAFPWAEYQTTTTREFYDLKPTKQNPLGMDTADANLIPGCPTDPESCVPGDLAGQYDALSAELAAVRKSAEPELTCLAKGDGNRDLRVNKIDLKNFKVFEGLGPSQYDINVDSFTDDADLAIIEANLGLDCLDVCTRADLDRDGSVNTADRKLLQNQNGLCEGPLCGGDLDGDGNVDLKDLGLMAEAANTCPSKAAALAE